MTDRLGFAALVVGLLCFGLIFAGSACAAEKNPCSEDIAKFCKDVKPGRGAIINCLEKHENELSDVCKAYEARMAGGRAERQERVKQLVALRQACKDDVAKFCKDVKAGSGGIARCLNEHQNELSAPCREGMAAMRETEGKKRVQ